MGKQPSIFFVTGVSKSGTTWLQRLLDSHPEILCKGEGTFFGKEEIRSLRCALERSEEAKRWAQRNTWTHGPNDPGLDEAVAVVARQFMLRKLKKARRRLPEKRIVGDKSPFSATSPVAEILRLLPSAKVIHIIRDGRDQAVSRLHHRWNRAETRPAERELSEGEQDKRKRYRLNPGMFGRDGESIFRLGQAEEWARWWAALVSEARREGQQYPARYAEVRYEALLKEPVLELSRLLRFLGADDTPEVTEACVEAASFERLSGRERGEEDPTSFYRKGTAGEWREVMTPEDEAGYQRGAGWLLEELGYARTKP